MAASATVRAIGPAVSWLWAIGMMPARLTMPIPGLSPTRLHSADGHRMEPSVSVPAATAHRLAATAAPEPELDPHGLRPRAYGFRHWPPRALQPGSERVDRKFAHSERLLLPSSTAPAARRRATTVASFAGFAPTSASEPAVVAILSAVSMLSLIRIGMPW